MPVFEKTNYGLPQNYYLSSAQYEARSQPLFWRGESVVTELWTEPVQRSLPNAISPKMARSLLQILALLLKANKSKGIRLASRSFRARRDSFTDSIRVFSSGWKADCNDCLVYNDEQKEALSPAYVDKPIMPVAARFRCLRSIAED